jgi:hypothetical protein
MSRANPADAEETGSVRKAAEAAGAIGRKASRRKTAVVETGTGRLPRRRKKLLLRTVQRRRRPETKADPARAEAVKSAVGAGTTFTVKIRRMTDGYKEAR